MEKFELKIDLNVLNHLGLNLYSNVPAVLSELIANSWDADSTVVEIVISDDEITITDNGCGMNESSLNEKFLTVGFERRKTPAGDLTPKYKRQVMGRKGIGKLSIFSISDYVEVYTKERQETIGISMDVTEIRKKIDQGQKYHPSEVTVATKNKIIPDSGTTIVLKKIKKRVSSSIDSNLKKRVSRRFDIFSDDFRVFINKVEISIEDRDYFHKLEFVTKYGDYPVKRFSTIEQVNIHERPLSALGENSISGWIGLVKESGGLQDGGDNLNKISILSRGKVALEDILDSYREGGLYTKFLIGEIRADFLDLTDQEDIATSSRQDFIQNDDRFIKLKKFIHGELKYIEQERVNYKEKRGVEKAEQIPAIKEWFSSLKGDARVSAKKLFGKINAIATDEGNRKTLYKHGVLAFEYSHHKQKLSQLDNLSIENLEETVNLFSELDDIEASWYYQITEGRLEVIKKLSDHVNTDALEKVIQAYIYDHLWLLDPSWERATESPIMEKSITTEFDKISKKLSAEEKNARIDIRYRKTSGKHIIIELKRSSVKPTFGDLTNQVKKYKRALKKQLQEHKENVDIEVICLIGNGLSEWDDAETKKEDEQALSQLNIKIITYQELIKDAQTSYQAYLNKGQDKGRIQSLLHSIEGFE